MSQSTTASEPMHTDDKRGVKRRREDETEPQNTIDLTEDSAAKNSVTNAPPLTRAESALAFRNGAGPVLAGCRSINEFEKLAEIGDGTVHFRTLLPIIVVIHNYGCII
jgi:hypothetical protein